MKAERPQITIWVHGTHFVSNGTLEQVYSLVDKVVTRFLKKEIPSFHARDGLHPVSAYNKRSYFTRKAKEWAKLDPQFRIEDFYIYGWSGRLSPRAREKCGINLYNDIQKLREAYRKKNNRKPIIRIITHSHGGNVALQLAKAEKLFHMNLVIDELILLACPVQQATEKLIHEPVFKTVYSLFSPKDLVQVMDPQKLHTFDFVGPLFSERCFKPADKIKQACITLNGEHLFLPHTTFITNKFTNQLPFVLKEMQAWKPGTIGEIDISA